MTAESKSKSCDWNNYSASQKLEFFVIWVVFNDLLALNFECEKEKKKDIFLFS